MATDGRTEGAMVAGAGEPLFVDDCGRRSRTVSVDIREPGRLRLLLLDFDGTLADTREANYRAYARTLAEVGMELERDEYFGCYFGVRCTEFLERKGVADPYERERLRRRKIELYPSCFGSVRLNEPLWRFVQTFRAAGGRAWVVSTGSPDNIRHAMEYLGLTDGVDGVVTGADVERSKPAPDGFLLAMERAGFGPEESLVFEDSAPGIEAARRSGAACVRVEWL